MIFLIFLLPMQSLTYIHSTVQDNWILKHNINTHTEKQPQILQYCVGWKSRLFPMHERVKGQIKKSVCFW